MFSDTGSEKHVSAALVDVIDSQAHRFFEIGGKLLPRMLLTPLGFSNDPNNFLVLLEFFERVDREPSPVEASARQPDALDARFLLVSHGRDDTGTLRSRRCCSLGPIAAFAVTPPPEKNLHTRLRQKKGRSI